MAIKTFYFKDAVPAGATLHRSLQDGGTAPTAATTTTGWQIATNAVGNSCIQNGGTEYVRNGANWGATLQPSATVSQTLGDCWRSENTLTGDFAATAWTITFGFRSVTAAWGGRLKLAVRLWRSANANGTSAVELTAGRVASAATTANLSTTVDTTLSWTVSPGLETFTNEYLFVQVGLEVTAVGTGTTTDFDFRVASTYTVVTPDFSVLVNPAVGSLALTGYAPTVTVPASNTDVLPNVGTLSLTGYSATVSQPHDTFPPAGSLSLSGYAPVTDQTRSAAPNVGSLVLSGYAPTVSASAGISANPATGSLVLSGYAPSVVSSAAANITPAQGDVSITGQAPVVSQPHRIDAGVGAVNITGPAPTVGQTHSASPLQGVISLTGYSPTVSATAAVNLTPAQGVISISGYQPTITQPHDVSVGVGSISITGYAVTVGQSQSASPTQGSISLSGYAPSVLQGITVSLAPEVGQLLISGYEPTVIIGMIVTTSIEADALFNRLLSRETLVALNVGATSSVTINHNVNTVM